VLVRGPKSVLVQFDDSVHVAGGNAAVANSTGASIAAGSAHARSRTLTIPLRPDLPDGAYSVRWSIVSDDGHHEVGVLAFAVGTDSPAPHSILNASAPLGPAGIVLRSIWYLGLLVAAGAAALALLTRGLAPARLRRPLAHLLFFALLLAFVGAGGLAHGGASGTRFANALDAALFVALVGATAAALAPRSEPLLRLAQGCALALLLAPTLAGHALDRDQPTLLAPLLDLIHLSAAAVWLGGLAWLLVVVPRATDARGERRGAVERFSTVALIAVSVLGATGIGRAVTELGSFHQLWTTSYGRALLVKTALFVPLLGIGWLNRGWLNRDRLNPGRSSRSASPGSLGRLRRTMRGEVVVIAGIVVAVAFLTQLRPGREAPAGATAAPVAASPPALPPRDAVVGAQELGRLAVAVAREPGRATVTVVGPDATGVEGLAVRIDGRVATPCGSGCYRARSSGSALHVAVGGGSLTFDLPSQAPAATALLARVGRAYRARRSLTISERLASSPANVELTRFELVAPNRLRYVTAGGPQAIVIGGRRWDRTSAAGPWVESPQAPLDVPQTDWRTATNVHLVGPRTLTFLDRSIPAWFQVTLEPRQVLPARLSMTAAAHFMVDRYSRFDEPLEISAPVSR
jgi:copper transport protein